MAIKIATGKPGDGMKLNRYLLCVTGLSGRPVVPAYLGELDAPVVMLDDDSLCLFTPVRWLPLRGSLQ